MTTYATIATDPCASYWLKDAATALQRRDPVDAVSDVEALLAAARARLTTIQGKV